MEPDYLEDLKAVLCDPEGTVSIHGSEMDRDIIQRCLAGLKRKVAELAAAMEWRTPTNLPETEKEVLLLRKARWGKDIMYDIGFYSHVLGYWRPRGSNGNFSDEIISWMPLPNAKTEEDK